MHDSLRDFVFALCGCAAGALAACAPAAQDTEISGAWFRPPLGGGEVGVAYFSIRSAQSDRILSVSSPQARLVEIHASLNEGGTATMQRVEYVDLPAGERIDFAPGGLHLMVFSPQRPAEGAAFPVIIELESGRSLDVAFDVSASGPPPSHPPH